MRFRSLRQNSASFALTEGQQYLYCQIYNVAANFGEREEALLRNRALIMQFTTAKQMSHSTPHRRRLWPPEANFLFGTLLAQLALPSNVSFEAGLS